jgi:glycosyltransferase involved in cell wall biosynthesis
VLVPFIVFLYCKFARANYYYHLQDIHPEATNVVIPLNRLVMSLLRWMDNLTMRNARALITLSADMRDFIALRSGTEVPIHLLDNSSFDVAPSENQIKSRDIVFCGNAGRLQRIPLLMTAISTYLQQGGKLNFTFVGAGVYGPNIAELAQSYDKVDFLGYLPAAEAAGIVRAHRWALLPIDDEVTRYAFPSKSSSYALSGCGVLAICGINTSVARWVHHENLGLTCEPNQDDLVRCFHKLEQVDVERFGASPELLHALKTSTFVERLLSICGVK